MEEKKKGDMPKYKGDGIAIWENKDKNGNLYLTCVLAGHTGVNAWVYEPKDKK